MSISTSVKSIQDIMRTDQGVDGDAQRIGQLVWIFFLKIWDDREQELELVEADFRSPLAEVALPDGGTADLRWRAWAADPEGASGDDLLAFVNETLFPAMKKLPVGPKVSGSDAAAVAADRFRRRSLLIRDIFADAIQYMKNGTLLRQVLNKVQVAIDFKYATGEKLHRRGEEDLAL